MAWLLPLAVFAQLSSTNYQVDVEYIGEEGGGYATSSNYQTVGSDGTPYEYDPTAPGESPVPGSSSGSRGSGGGSNPSSPSSDGQNDYPGPDGTPSNGNGGQGEVGSGDAERPGSAGGGEQGRAEDGTWFRPSYGTWPIKEVVSDGAISIKNHLREMFLERPYFYGTLLLGILLLILFMLQRARREEEE